MKKIFVALLVSVFALSFFGCKSLTSEELLVKAILQSSTIRNYSNSIEYSASMPDILDEFDMLPMGNVVVSLDTKSDIETYMSNMDGKFKFGGFSFETSLYSSSDEFYFANPIGEGYYMWDMDDMMDEADVDYDIEEMQEISLRIQEEFMEFIIDKDMLEIFVLEEPVSEKITINGKNVSTKCVSWGLDDDVLLDKTIDILEFFKESDAIEDYMELVDYEELSDGAFDMTYYGLMLNEFIDEIEAIKEGETYQEEYEEIVDVLKQLDGAFYFANDGYMVRTVLNFEYDIDEEDMGDLIISVIADTYDINNTVVEEKPDIDDDLILDVQDLIDDTFGSMYF